MESQTSWLENLRKFKTLNELGHSDFFAECGGQIESYLRTSQIFFNAGAKPILRSFLRIVQWNIEKGKRFKSILEKLQTDGILRWADVIILNEADFGMVRSENRHVAKDLAEALGMHAAFGPAHLELTKGIGEELDLPGENRESVQGNAVLSRYPIQESRIIQLPVTFEPYGFHEKRFGRRNCLWVQLHVGPSAVWVGAVHLELRNTPKCRAQQIRHILKNLPGAKNSAVILGGDLNTNSFGRGTTWRTLKSVLRLLFSRPERLKNRLFHPESGDEPLFRILEGAGFDWAPLNSNCETARTCIDSLEESASLPDSILRLIQKRLEPYQSYLCFKLDWLVGKNVRALSSGERRDVQTGVLSLNPGAVKGQNWGPDRISDHLPIYADIDLA